ncbi:unnamed protein product [Paramecium sonneborni]|uniref:Transmembrane protein n=1 Tax=Paramecium sonneborni TaxID=65129 RepID=A0A8S1NAV8_9CILI|nr:unnamed protein product [Paramecium sonneborni]
MNKIIFFIITLLHTLILCQNEFSHLDDQSSENTQNQSNEELQNRIKSKIENQEIQSSFEYDDFEEEYDTLVNYQIGEEQTLDAQYTFHDDETAMNIGADFLEIIRDELLYSDTHNDKPDNIVIDASQNLQDETPSAINFEQNELKLCSSDTQNNCQQQFEELQYTQKS